MMWGSLMKSLEYANQKHRFLLFRNKSQVALVGIDVTMFLIVRVETVDRNDKLQIDHPTDTFYAYWNYLV